MINVETLTEFKRLGAGTILPDGVLLAHKFYGHMRAMGMEEEHKRLKAEYWESAHEQVEQEEAWAIEQGGEDAYFHPEWHRFEMGDDTESQAYQLAYEQGFVKLASYTDSRNGEYIIYVESIPETIKKHKKLLDDLKEILEAKLVIESV